MDPTLLSDIVTLAPEIMLALGTMALMMVGVFGHARSFRLVSGLSVSVWLIIAAYILVYTDSGVLRIFNDKVIVDGFAATLKLLLTGGAIAALMIGVKDMQDTVMARFEYPVLMGFSLLGMYLMVSANDLLMLYVGLELSSLSLYVLAAFNRNSAISSEAGLKYFVLGAISSGLLLFGASLLYGYTGSTQFDVIQATLAVASVPGPAPLIAVFGMVMVLAGMAFKIAAVPFHMWTPDVYDGAPTSVTAFFAIVPKVAAMGLLIRLLTGPFAALSADWQDIVTVMAVASMVIGSFAAIVQTNIKRLLAYSSIGNVGYALIGVVTNTHFGYAAVIAYLAIYMITSVGVFGIILMLRRNGEGITKINDLAGLSKTHPLMAYGMAILMFSMAGIPPMAGFFGKLVVFQAAVMSQMYVLAVIGVLTSVVSAWYYINVIRVMFFEEADIPLVMNRPGCAMLVTALSLAFVVLLIFMPGPLNAITADATSVLMAAWQ